MRLLKPTLTSIYGLLGHMIPTPARSAESRMENIRKVMLDAMSIEGGTGHHHLTVRRVFYATDIQTLWYARSDVMSVLSEEMGDTSAHEELCVISELFDGLLPEAKHSLQSRSALNIAQMISCAASIGFKCPRQRVVNASQSSRGGGRNADRTHLKWSQPKLPSYSLWEQDMAKSRRWLR